MINYEVFFDSKNNNHYVKNKNRLLQKNHNIEVPIVNDIPRFSDSDYAGNFGDQWNDSPEDQFDESENEYKKLDRSFTTLQEVFPIDLAKIKNCSVLEAGSGNGRFTYVMLKNGAKVDSFDISHAVDAHKKNMIKRKLWNKNLSLAQANILNMPYKKMNYDFVVCMHVLQHTPSPEKSIEKLWEMVKPGGCLVIDHYRFILKSLYPPIGGFGNLFRHITLFLPYKWQKPFSDSFVKFWFPIHWYFKDSKIMQQILLRMSPVRFYYPWLGLPDKDTYFRKALLDTHDGSTDVYHHTRTVKQIDRVLAELSDISDYKVFKGGNGVLAWAYKKKNIHFPPR
ncbi:MAG: hypothetical protein CMB31_05870 [Euryarchaeota archaeon]|nr:hypothetical protein [Euryarchaeota archaeon]